MSGVERYLKQNFRTTQHQGTEGRLPGAEEAQGVGQGRRQQEKAGQEGRRRQARGQRKPARAAEAGPSAVVSADGMAPLKRKKPTAE
ncbi:hypothetical protein ACPA9J_30495 [Pseudomonas aeruginosa]